MESSVNVICSRLSVRHGAVKQTQDSLAPKPLPLISILGGRIENLRNPRDFSQLWWFTQRGLKCIVFSLVLWFLPAEFGSLRTEMIVENFRNCRINIAKGQRRRKVWCESWHLFEMTDIRIQSGEEKKRGEKRVDSWKHRK